MGLKHPYLTQAQQRALINAITKEIEDLGVKQVFCLEKIGYNGEKNPLDIGTIALVPIMTGWQFVRYLFRATRVWKALSVEIDRTCPGREVVISPKPPRFLKQYASQMATGRVTIREDA